MRLRPRAATAAALGTIAFAWGCNAILGNSDGVYVDAGDTGDGPASDSDRSGDAASDSTTTDALLTDSSTTDATDAGPDTSCSTDLAIDPRNCGACGHDCLLGACAASSCQPFVLVGDAASPDKMIVTATSIYWSSEGAGTINRVEQDGTGKQEILAPGSNAPTDIALDPTGVYYTANPTDGGNVDLRQCPLSAPCTPPELTTFPGAATQVAADGVNVYVAAPPSKIFKVRESDNQNTVLVAGLLSVAHVVSAPPFLYWAEFSGRIGRIRTDGTDGGFAVNTVGTPAFFQVRGNRAAWGGSLVTTTKYGSCDVTNCLGTTLNLTRPEEGTAVDVDATTLYWATQGSSAISDGTVQSCSFADACATVRVRATGQAQPNAMGVTPQAIYWLNGNGGGVGAVMGVAK